MQRPHGTGVANGASGGRTFTRRLPRIVLILLSLGLLSSATVAVAQGPGLYKDGQKLIDFEDVLSSSLEQLSDPQPARSAARPALHQSISDVTRSRSFPERDTYLRSVGECRKLVSRATAEGSLQPAAGDVTRLLNLKHNLSQTGQALLDRYERMADDLARAGFSAEKLARHTGAIERQRQALAGLTGLLSDLSDAETAGDQAGAAQALYELQQFFADQSPPPNPALLDPTPRPMLLEPVAPPPIRDDADQRRPAAYPLASAQAAAYDPADLVETVDIQFTDDIVALAAELNHSPAAIYEYVRNNCTFESYLGSRKGSQQTLEHMCGNDYDLASLTIALLRTSGIPARYAGGRSYVPADRVKNWLGFDDLLSAAIMLQTAGRQVSLHGPTGDTTGLSFKRVWVEAWVPFVNYRGTVNDSLGCMWVPLDPAFKQYDYDPGIYLYGEMNFNAGLFLSDYYSTFHADPPIEAFKQLMIDSLAVYHPGATYDDLFRSRTVIAEADGIMPGTLPYELLSYDSSFSEIPADMRYGIGFHVYNSGASLDYTTTLPEIASKQLTLSYVGATAGDQNIIDTAGGIWNIELPWMVDLVPVVNVDGCEVAHGTGAVMMGEVQNSDMSFTPPSGAPVQSPFVYNYITAGNSQGLGVDTEDALPSLPESPETACAEDNLQQVLHQTSLTYLNNVDMADDELAGLMHVVLTNDIAEAIVENTVSIGYGPYGAVSFTWTGMIVDADRKIVGPYSAYGYNILCDFMKISGADGSVQENRLFETLYDVEAVSTIKIFEICSDSGIALCTLTSGGVTCATLNQPEYVIDQIEACVEGGSEVVIPQSQLTYYDWIGTGWTCMNPDGCGAGYIISGGKSGEIHAGGETVEEWDVTYPNLLCLQPIGP
ncbi:MAG TPA: transglutaminase-like domain-containing protein, partial [Acidobacteriota bacterium]|nr:transglutaminase-like domain-containing protein [Acidobacteriota bacterium]